MRYHDIAMETRLHPSSLGRLLKTIPALAERQGTPLFVISRTLLKDRLPGFTSCCPG